MELYKKVMACAEGMSARASAKHFNISRGTVDKMMAFSVPPGYRAGEADQAARAGYAIWISVAIDSVKDSN